jgi:hypothetical protein
MGTRKFNDQSEKPKFIAKPNQLVPNSWQIFEFKDDKNDYEPVGNYTLIETSEPIDITEKKIINLVRILNGKRDLIALGKLTGKRILFSIVSKGTDADPTKIIFRDHDGKGVSKENAVLTLEKGVLHDETNNS